MNYGDAVTVLVTLVLNAQPRATSVTHLTAFTLITTSSDTRATTSATSVPSTSRLVMAY